MAERDAYEPFPNLSHRNFLQESIEVPIFVRALGLHRGARVLEVGCGRGVALPVISRMLQPTLLVGLDIEHLFLREAEARCGDRVDILACADLRAMPFPDSSFDVVIDFGTCYHVGHPRRAITEITRVLAHEGVFATETRFSQLLAHPIRTRGRRLPLRASHALRRRRHAGLWATYMKLG